MTALSRLSLDQAKRNTEYWGRVVESSVGAALYNGLPKHEGELFYWHERNHEIDFALVRGDDVVAIEVKSGRGKSGFPGMEKFSSRYKVKRKLLVGGDGIPLEEFLLTPPLAWFD